jgi:hypothetical protein
MNIKYRILNKIIVTSGNDKTGLLGTGDPGKLSPLLPSVHPMSLSFGPEIEPNYMRNINTIMVHIFTVRYGS